MNKKILIIFGLFVLAVGICFALDFITLSAYESASTVSVDRQNASALISHINTLLTNVRASGVTITSAARSGGSPTLHPKSRAVDLRWDQNLYNNIVANIGGSGLRVECIECIREIGQADHIHLDIGGPNGEGLPLGRLFHLNHDYTITNNQDSYNLTTYGNIVIKQFYGPPNFGETPAIDRVENCYILRLHRPITLRKGGYSETVQEIQLILYNPGSQNFNINQSYYVAGKAFFWETGHHHTPIMIDVERVYR
jgi:hypothetical protein